MPGALAQFLRFRECRFAARSCEIHVARSVQPVAPHNQDLAGRTQSGGRTAALADRPVGPLLAFTCCNAAFRFSRSHTSSINRFVLAGFSVPLIAPDGSVSSLPAFRASPVSAEEKSSSIWMFCCRSSLRFMAYWPLLLVRAFSHRSRLGLSVDSTFRLRSASLALPTT